MHWEGNKCSYLLGVEMTGNFSFLCIYLKNIIRVLGYIPEGHVTRNIMQWCIMNSAYFQFVNWHKSSTRKSHNNKKRKVIKVNSRQIKSRGEVPRLWKICYLGISDGSGQTPTNQKVQGSHRTPVHHHWCWNPSGNHYKWVPSHREHLCSSCDGF